MNKPTVFLFFILFSLCSYTIKAQSGIIIEESANIKELMNIKKEFIKQEKCFQIQVFNGRIDQANQIMQSLKANSKYTPKMTFETPNYKVRTGRFRTRIEAEKALTELKSEFPSAFVIYN